MSHPSVFTSSFHQCVSISFPIPALPSLFPHLCFPFILPFLFHQDWLPVCFFIYVPSLSLLPCFIMYIPSLTFPPCPIICVPRAEMQSRAGVAFDKRKHFSGEFEYNWRSSAATEQYGISFFWNYSKNVHIRVIGEIALMFVIQISQLY